MEYQFSPIRFDNRGYIRDSVFSILRNAILDGKLEPGQRLVERNIAEQLKISRTPVREAIRQLQYERLVTYIPRKGVVVSGFSKEDIEEIQLIRTTLEALSCSIAAVKINDKELNYLNSVVGQMVEEYKKENNGKLSSLNKKFHECIWKSADSPHLYYFINTLCEYVNKFTHLTYTKPGRIEEVVLEHNEIVDALQRHDSQAAYDAMKKHVENSGHIFLSMAYSDKNK
ncbi:GntR family transcriptional regulator [Clostridium luticellarii]|uniref:HTH-type transcriptional regulator McbR n=1 Tax=Clostridium luticellarii TaxID=1691940 RepID=A0A2T0BMG1_9CLOT|nr:GntR family transcriptional regulator [Clostridium luticellarii]MCI1945274.1 GntR family transcriptional regulator [Clostridium luticellarii]MCI1969014.1 GntR family transcriptional regulator [Clostridium luticellarii]MCI1994607.1 GntR family transcriptional regulator [Clostridium luticellarii]MCI2038896.1 GntR family transcriptional regulator [Clostridium luticellarii]PRR85074.1 HTH-type transcriptional regulator McbR [Clostridium luticellarii]